MAPHLKRAQGAYKGYRCMHSYPMHTYTPQAPLYVYLSTHMYACPERERDSEREREREREEKIHTCIHY